MRSIPSVQAPNHGARTIEVPSPDLRHDLDGMIAAITPKTRLIFVANPNNPTGTLASQGEIDRFVDRVPENVVVVFDEAYFEYLDDPPDTLRFVRAGRNVAVLRTFSKIQGLASLRIGYGIARPELIQVLQKTRQPFNVNGLAQAAALAGLAAAASIVISRSRDASARLRHRLQRTDFIDRARHRHPGA